MTRSALLESLKIFIEKNISDIKLPTVVQKNDTEIKLKCPEVYKMRLPDSSAAKKVVPYILIQFINGMDKQQHTKNGYSTAVIRFIFTVYDDDEQEGAMMLLNLMDTVRIALLKKVVIGGCFKLDTDEGLESLVYIDDTAPYFAGEMMGTFILPAVEREVNYE